MAPGKPNKTANSMTDSLNNAMGSVCCNSAKVWTTQDSTPPIPLATEPTFTNLDALLAAQSEERRLQRQYKSCPVLVTVTFISPDEDKDQAVGDAKNCISYRMPREPQAWASTLHKALATARAKRWNGCCVWVSLHPQSQAPIPCHGYRDNCLFLLVSVSKAWAWWERALVCMHRHCIVSSVDMSTTDGAAVLQVL